jgi:hypothetical protein
MPYEVNGVRTHYPVGHNGGQTMAQVVIDTEKIGIDECALQDGGPGTFRFTLSKGTIDLLSKLKGSKLERGDVVRAYLEVTGLHRDKLLRGFALKPRVAKQKDCPACEGKGVHPDPSNLNIEMKCSRCNGTGKVEKAKKPKTEDMPAKIEEKPQKPETKPEVKVFIGPSEGVK